MKKLMFLSLAGFLMAACSVDSVENEDFQVLDSKVAKANSQDVSFIIPDPLCAGEEAEFCIEFPQDYAGPNTKETNVLVQQLLMGDDPETTEVEDEYWELIFRESSNTKACFNYIFETIGDHQLRYKVGKGDFTEITVTVEDCNDCINELTADLTCNETSNTLVMTFTAEEAGDIVIQGGLNANTKILSKESNILTSNEDHPSFKEFNANVTRWEGYVEACEEVVITIEFEGVGEVDNWSAKRTEGEGEKEEEIVLGETEPQSCE